MPQHYIKIEIQGESDLPKKDDWYPVHSKGANMNDYHNSCWMGGYYKEAWMENYDYYLMPEPQQPEQAESAIQKAIQFIKENPYQDDFVNKCYRLTNQEGDDNTIESSGYWREQFDILIDFISQSHNNTVVGPSKDMIERECGKRYYIMEGSTDLEFGFKEGAEYALSQCKAVDLRATLIKFMKEYKKRNAYMLILDEHIENEVDDYLKSPENK